jgi:hypothetical protein
VTKALEEDATEDSEVGGEVGVKTATLYHSGFNLDYWRKARCALGVGSWCGKQGGCCTPIVPDCSSGVGE